MIREISELAEELQMPREEIELMLSAPDLNEEKTAELALKLTRKTEYEEAHKELSALTQNGHTILKVMLRAALLSRDLYRERGIPKEIYIDTMKCFTRFVNEHFESYNAFGFDRGFWVGRQLSLQLFRIGTLEYELVTWKEKDALSVHIPSDADLSEESLNASFRAARKFFAQSRPAYADCAIICNSWLLSPALPKLLPAHSKILVFQRKFRLISVEESDGYKYWVYKRSDLAPADFPENTSLQRNMKAYVLGGGSVGEGFGEYIG